MYNKNQKAFDHTVKQIRTQLIPVCLNSLFLIARLRGLMPITGLLNPCIPLLFSKQHNIIMRHTYGLIKGNK